MTNLIPILLTMYIILAIISALGKDVIIDLAWKLYLLFPGSIRSKITEQKSLQKELLQTSAALKSTSSQDEFAKWARLNRQHDKQAQTLQSLTSNIEDHETKFRRIVGWAVWLGTTGVKGGVQWWFSREAVFWLPSGAFPGWVEYVLAFPKAPRGGVSTMVFGMCATRVIAFIVTFAKDAVEVRSQRQAVPVTAGSKIEEVTSDESKKTL